MRKHSLALLTLLGLLALPSMAQASKMYIREFKSIASLGPIVAQVAPEPGLDQTPIDFGAGSISSQPFAGSTHLIEIICDASCSYVVAATSVTATANNMLLPAGVYKDVAVPPGYVISVTHNP